MAASSGHPHETGILNLLYRYKICFDRTSAFSLYLVHAITQCYTKMKVQVILSFVVLFAFVKALENGENCKCFEEFHPEREGDRWICRGDKHSRIFNCGEETPPLCRCYNKGREVILDIGETNCADVEMHYDLLYCEPRSEWESYYNDHPYRRILYFTPRNKIL
nr:uncharacterized protein LOC111503617 isoform X1 [Leptinotarsa decemlineata]